MRTQVLDSLRKRLVFSMCIILSALLMMASFFSVRKTDALASETVYTLYDTNGNWSREAYDNIIARLGFSSEAQMLANTTNKNAEALNGTNGANEWTVKIDGIDFAPVYLTNDVNGNVILTLWQSFSTDTYYFNESYTEVSSVYPRSNNYATSFVRTHVLNNVNVNLPTNADGKHTSYYYTGYGDSRNEVDVNLTQELYEATYGHQYSAFTLGEISEYIVAPKDVTTNLVFPEGYVNDLDDRTTGYYGNENSVYYEWGEDKIWLPSVNEIMYQWRPTENQRRNAVATWLRSAPLPNETTNSYNSAFKQAYRLDPSTGQTRLSEKVSEQYAARFAFHLNLTDLAKKMAPTSPYSKTNTPNNQFIALQNAWRAAIDNSGNTAYGSKQNPNIYAATDGTKVAEVYYDPSYGTIVFKMYADWGAKEEKFNSSGAVIANQYHDYPVFGGVIETKNVGMFPSCSYYSQANRANTKHSSTDVYVRADKMLSGAERYFFSGALYVGPGVKLTIDLNGHTINRNVYDPSAMEETFNGAHKRKTGTWNYTNKAGKTGQLYYGEVIYMVEAELTIDDTNESIEYADVNENGVKNIGRITGGSRRSNASESTALGDDGLTAYTWSAQQGSGICAYGYNANNIKSKLNIKNGAICYNDAFYRAGAYHGEATICNMTGGMMVHNSSSGLGGAVYQIHQSVLNLYSGFVSYNYGGDQGGAIYLPDGGVSTLECFGVSMCNNYCGGTGGAITASYGDAANAVHRVIIHSGTYNNNYAVTNGGFFQTKSGGNYTATLTVNGGVFKNNGAGGSGGFMYANNAKQGATPIIITDGLIEGNYAQNGGFLYIRGTSSGFNYMANVTVSGGTFKNNSAIYTAGNSNTGNGGAIYQAGGTYTMTGGLFEGNSGLSGGAVYMSTGTMNLYGGSFLTNYGQNYPGFYCGGTVNVKGNITIRGNRQSDSSPEKNVILASGVTVKAVGALTGYLGITTAASPTKNNPITIAQGVGYTMSTSDLLVFHCDGGENYLFSVGNPGTSSSYVYMSIRDEHKHSYEYHSQNALCVTPGYGVRVCTGCQEIETNQGTSIITYFNPTGHNYVWNDAEGCFVCNTQVNSSGDICGDRVYLEIDPLPNVSFTGAFSGQNVTWRLYKLNRGMPEYFENYSGDINVTYTETTVVGPVYATITFTDPTDPTRDLRIAESGKYVVPYGSNAGQETNQTWTASSTLTGSFTRQMYNITKTNVSVSVETPNEPRGGWFVADAERVFGDITATASVNGGANVVNHCGDLMWKINGEWSTATPALLAGENNYEWRWTPNATYASSLDTYEGFVTINAREYELKEILAEKNDNTAIFDNIGMAAAKDMFTVTATYIIDDNGHTEDEILTSADFDMYLLPDKNNLNVKYDYLRAGAYYFYFEYIYAGITKSFVTEDSYNVAVVQMESITVERVKDDDDNIIEVYDSIGRGNVDKFRPYLIVTGTKNNGDTEVLNSYILECDDFNRGVVHANYPYRVYVIYGDIEEYVDILVIPNTLENITVSWTQTKPTDTFTLPEEINDYGDLVVTAHYINGDTKIIPIAQQGIHGYTVSGDLSRVAPDNVLTINYSEANTTNGIVYTASTTIKAATVNVAVKSVTYSLKENQAFFSGDTAEQIENKINVFVTYQNEITQQVYTITEAPSGSRVYFEVPQPSERNGFISFSINIYDYTTDDILLRDDYRVTPSTPEIVDIIVQTVSNIPDEIPETTSLSYIKENYIKIYEVFNTNDARTDKVYDPSDNTMATANAAVLSKITLSVPAAQDGKLIIGSNIITVSYVASDSKTYTKVLPTITVVPLALASVKITIKDNFAAEGSATTIKDGKLFSSSTPEDIKQFITVKGVKNNGDEYDIPITEYEVSVADQYIDGNGKLVASSTPIDFTITASAVDDYGETTTKDAHVFAPVDAVILDHITAVFNQGDKKIYENTTIGEILQNIVVTTHFNDGSTGIVYSGFSVEILNNDEVSGFDLEGDNTLRVTYGTKTYKIVNGVTVSQKVFEYITVESRQYGSVLYPTSTYDEIKDCILVVAHYSDNTTKNLDYGTEYTLLGAFQGDDTYDGVYAYYSEGEGADKVESLKKVDMLTITPLAIIQITQVDTTELESINFYSSYTMDMVKNYIVVSAKFNNGTTRALASDEYTLSGSLNEGTNTLTATANGKIKTFTITVLGNAVTGIASVAAKADNPTLYASIAPNKLNSYLTVTASLSDGNTSILESNEFIVEGTILDTGVYNLTIKIKGFDYSIEGNDPFTFSSNDSNPILTFVKIVPIAITLTNVQGDNKIIFGATLQDASEYLTVVATYNDSAATYIHDNSSKTLIYGEYTLAGTLMAFDAETPCAVTASYTYNGVTVTDTENVKVSPVVNDAITASLSIDPADLVIYYSQIYDENDTVKSNLNSILAGLLEDYITVKYVKNNGVEEVMYDYRYTACSVVPAEGITTPQDVKKYGGYVAITIQEYVAGSAGSLDPTTINLYLTAIEPVRLQVSQETTIYSTSSNDKIAQALIVTEVYNDGSTRSITSGYNVTAIRGTIVLGGEVTLRVSYYDDEALRSVTGNIVVDVVLLQPTAITVDVNTHYPIYASTSESAIRSLLTVTASYNDPEKEDALVADFTIDPYTLVANTNVTLTVRYALNGTEVNCQKVITVQDDYVKSLQFELNGTTGNTQTYEIDGVDTEFNLNANSYITYDETNNEFVFTGRTIYNSHSLNSLRNYIKIDAIYDAAGNTGAIESYSLDLRSQTWGVDAEGYRDLIVYVNFTGTSVVSVDSISFKLRVIEYTIKWEQDGVKKTYAFFNNSNLTIYEDYDFDTIANTLKNNVLVSAEWTDGYNHASQFALDVKEIEQVEGFRNKFNIKYTYAKIDATNPEVHEDIAEINLIGLLIASITINMDDAENYIYYSNETHNAIIAKIPTNSTLTATYNSGNSENVSWTEGGMTSTGVYTSTADGSNVYTFTFSGANIVGGSKTATVSAVITPIALTKIEVEYTQYEPDPNDEDDKTGIIYTSANAQKILSAGAISMKAYWNYGQIDNVQVLPAYLSFDFTVSDTVTVTYNDLTDTFDVLLHDVELDYITAEKTSTTPVYTSSSISSLAPHITVVAHYNDGNTRTLTYGISGDYKYKFTDDSTILLPSTETKYFDVTVEYTEGYATERATIENIKVDPDNLIEINAAYQQISKLYQSGGIDAVISAPNSLVVNATYENNGTKTLSVDQYQVVYKVGGVVQSELPASGACILTVLFVYNGETYDSEFEITITAKEAKGIEVIYTANGRDIYTTTALEELVKDVTYGENTIEAKGSVTVYLLYNDGDRQLLEDLVYGTDYTLSGNLSASNVVTLTYGSFSNTFNVLANIPKIISLNARWAEGFTLYVNSTRESVRNNIIVVGHYNDDGHTEDLTLTIAQYSLRYAIEYIGATEFNISPTIAVDPSCDDVVLIGVAKQMITASTSKTLQYKNSDDQWVNVPSSGLVERAATELRLMFKAEDEEKTPRYITLDTSVITVKDGIWIIPEDQLVELYTYNLPIISVQNDSEGMFVIDSGLTTTPFKLVKKMQTGVDVIYTKYADKTIYTTTTLDELVKDVTYTTPTNYTVSAKGVLEIYRLYNDGDRVLDPTITYALSGRLNEGSNNINISIEGGTYSFRVTAVNPSVIDATISLGTTQFTYDESSIEDVVDALVIYGIYDDDNTQPNIINVYPSMQYYINESLTTTIGDPFVDGAVGKFYARVSINTIPGIPTEVVSFDIVQSQIRSTSVSDIWTATYEFTGAIPTFDDLVIVQDGKRLINGVDYTLTPAQNYFAGDNKSLTVTAQGNYKGALDLKYAIVCATSDENYDTSKIALVPDASATYTYNAHDITPIYTVTYDGVEIEDETISITYYTDEDRENRVNTAVAARTYYYTVQVGGTNIVATNLNGQFTINKSPIKFAALDATSVYGSAISDLSSKWQLVSGDNHDNIIPTVNTTSTTTTAVGVYENAISLEIAQNYYDNYEIDITEKATHTITKKAISVVVSVKNQTVSYGATYEIVCDLTSSGFVGEDKNITLTNPVYSYTGIDGTSYPTSQTKPTAVGTYSVTLSGSGLTATADNYTVTVSVGTTTATLTIEPPKLIRLKPTATYKFTRIVRNGLKYSYQESTTHGAYDPNDLEVLMIDQQKLKIQAVLDCLDVNIDFVKVYNAKGALVAASKYNNAMTTLGTGYRIQLVIDDVVLDEIVITLQGDTNEDGKLTTNDLIGLSRAIEGKTLNVNDKTTLYKFYAADINKDGKITTNDLIVLSRSIS